MEMKPGVSTLNPYAASYIPLSKRESGDRIVVPGWTTTKAPQSGNQTIWHGPSENMAQNGQNDRAASIPEVFALKSQSAHGFYGSSSKYPNEMTEKQMLDEESELDLEYLRISFPGISDESLIDVYVANKGDLEAAIDMIQHLEFDAFEFSENLPDTLDIGDVSESGPSAESSSVKQKKVVSEAGPSSTSDSVVVT